MDYMYVIMSVGLNVTISFFVTRIERKLFKQLVIDKQNTL